MPAPRTLLVALALSSACAHAPAPRPGDDRLVKVGFEGNKQLSDSRLLTGLALHRVLKRNGSPDPYQVGLDADRLRGEYLRKGYLDVDVRSRVERKGDTATVIYTVEEGVRATTETVINGLPDDLPPVKVREQLPLKDGQPFDYEIYDLAKPKLLVAVQDAGYARAKLESTVIADRAEHKAIVQLDYSTGPKCTFGRVEVTGVKGELAEAVRARIAFEPGQTYSTQAIVQTQRNLYGFGRFSTVRVEPDKASDRPDDPVVGVSVAVAEGARHELTLGGGLGMDQDSYEVRGRSGYKIAGWPFPLDTVTLDFRPAYAYVTELGTFEPRIRALAKLERDDLFWTYAKGTIEAGYDYLTVEAFTSYGPRARLGFETRLGTDRVKLRVGWALQRSKFTNVNPLIDPALREELGIAGGTQRVAAYQQALIVDLRDHPIEPRLGAYGEVRIAEGTKAAGGEFEFFEVMPDIRGFLPLFGDAVLAGRARFGAIYGDTVPATERLFSGGATSQRGFGERRLAPSRTGMDGTKTETVPYGGGALIETSIEARVPVMKIRNMPLGFVVFLDGADVQETPGDLQPTQLHWAAGAGLRLNTIVGPIRLDVGYRLNRKSSLGEARMANEMGMVFNEPAPGSTFAYHLTIGEAF